MVMEVSSPGLMLHRTQGFVFDFGIFTNIEPDHIGPNEHKDFDDYLRCKSLLLKQCKVGIVNRDDEHFEKIIEGHTCSLETYGFSPEADLRAEDEMCIRDRVIFMQFMEHRQSVYVACRWNSSVRCMAL